VTLPRASVIIPHLNTPDLLERCLASVVVQQLDHGSFEVIVVDNGSTVPFDTVREKYPDVVFLHEPEPGPGLARNRGIAHAGAAVVVFIDADCRAAPGWLQAAAEAVETDPERVVAGGAIDIDTVDPRNMTGMEAYESVFGFRQQWYIAKRHFSVTANLAMGAAVHRAVGPFAGIDTAEDFDWGQRATAKGYPPRYVAEMLVYHPARPDFDSMARKWQRLIHHTATADRLAHRTRWPWRLRAVALVLAVPVQAARLLTSPRLAGVGNRGRGVLALARINLFRSAEMLRAARPTKAGGATLWNR
jgi:glycosyltransferase involved in cell wall biosynthesis